MSSQNPKPSRSPDPKTLKDPEPKQPPEESPNKEEEDEVALDPKTLNDPESKQPPEESPNKEEEDDEEEEEEGECGFCLFMKAGGCKESFVGWEDCIRDAEGNNEDIAEKCFEATSALKKCMEAHANYYEPILRAEKKAEERVVIELEKEKEKETEDSKDLQKNSDGR